MLLAPDQYLRALSDTTRLRIVMLLLKFQELCVCELTAALDLPQPKISRHLGILRAAGVVLDRREGLWIHYRIHPELPAWAANALQNIAEGCARRKPFTLDRKRIARKARGDGLATCG